MLWVCRVTLVFHFVLNGFVTQSQRSLNGDNFSCYSLLVLQLPSSSSSTVWFTIKFLWTDRINIHRPRHTSWNTSIRSLAAHTVILVCSNASSLSPRQIMSSSRLDYNITTISQNMFVFIRFSKSIYSLAPCVAIEILFLLKIIDYGYVMDETFHSV